jgi:hypothetical protein
MSPSWQWPATYAFALLARLARTRFPEGRQGDVEASLAVAMGVASPA